MSLDERLLQVVRCEIVGVARKKGKVSYGELSKRVGKGDKGRWLRWHLDAINHRETAEKRPMLSAVVVNNTTGMPGDEFWDCSEGCGMCDRKGSPEDFWKKELKLVWNYWADR